MQERVLEQERTWTWRAGASGGNNGKPGQGFKFVVGLSGLPRGEVDALAGGAPYKDEQFTQSSNTGYPLSNPLSLLLIRLWCKRVRSGGRKPRSEA